MTNGERLLVGFAITVLIVICAVIGFKTIKNNMKETYSNIPDETNSSIFNKYENNQTSDVSNEIEENKIVDNNEKTEVENTVKEEKKVVKEQVTGKEEEETAKEVENTKSSSKQITESKALDLVKKTWGNDDSVYYTIANKDDQNYYVSVNDNSSTSVLAWYAVNIITGEVKEN